MTDQQDNEGRDSRSRTDDFGHRWGYSGENAAWDYAAEEGTQDAGQSDERIREEISSRLRQHTTMTHNTIEVEVHEGVVTLRGMVDSQRSSDLATEAAKSVPGVREVQNQLEVKL